MLEQPLLIVFLLTAHFTAAVCLCSSHLHLITDLTTFSGVKGSQNPSHVRLVYSSHCSKRNLRLVQCTIFLGHTAPPTPLWTTPSLASASSLPLPSSLPSNEQPSPITIDRTSVLVPGFSTPQTGFRRTELIAQKIIEGAENHTALNELMEVGVSFFDQDAGEGIGVELQP
jgi:hypothetical protein